MVSVVVVEPPVLLPVIVQDVIGEVISGVPKITPVDAFKLRPDGSGVLTETE